MCITSSLYSEVHTRPYTKVHTPKSMVYTLDFTNFHMLQTTCLYVSYKQSYSQNRLNQSKLSNLVISVSMVTGNLIMFYANILDFISFPMLQTRSRYAKYERSYSQKRLNQSKFSISDSIVTTATIII